MKTIKQTDERIEREQGLVYKQGFWMLTIGYFICTMVGMFTDIGYVLLDCWVMLGLCVMLFKMASRGVLFAESDTLPPLAWKLVAGYAVINSILLPAAFFYIGGTMGVQTKPWNMLYGSIVIFIISFCMIFGLGMLLISLAFRLSRKKRLQQETAEFEG